ncbi:hypothetical protein EDF39_1791, partial [Frondihabitans sp. PhB161]
MINIIGSQVRLVLENSTACTLSNAKLYLGIQWIYAFGVV